ncbi:cysteine synthase A [Aminivibrio sp.]|jgi:cysteine synthase A|uniref:cysteine synthase A n=1 Tax=Aminivibrio sp. TaxID=1872489 RepID=UPI001A404D62|nr:cysteine synthase A [Aminivibrio sp.]MBL3539741.1 cysteine synthase A [Aminivibrio sp.]
MRYKVDEIAIATLIGNTPFFRLEDTGGARILIKLEGNNPGGSVKDRTAWGMLHKAEADGLLNENSVIVEPTSGNTGIALAMLGGALGLRVVLTMPESMSVERRKLLSAYGAELVLTPASEGMKGAVDEAHRIVESTVGAFLPDQFSNPGNPWAHQVTTAAEILRGLPLGLTPAAFVAGVGTGGTITGVGRTFKQLHPSTKIVAVEPAESPLLSKGEAGKHKIQGIGANFVPEILDRSVLDEVVTVSGDEAVETARRLSKKHGLSSGISTGANIAAALKIARTLPADDVVVTLQVDRGDRYLSIFSAH